MRMLMLSDFNYLAVFFVCLLSLTPTDVRAQSNPPARIIRPTEQQTFYYLDTVEVAYESEFSSPWLHTWCEVDGVPQEKSRTQVDGFNASALVRLAFKDGGNGGNLCWFQLTSNGENEPEEITSPPFEYVEVERAQTAVLTDRAGPALGTQRSGAMLIVPRSNTTVDCRTEESAAKTNDPPVPDMLGTHVGIGVAAAVGGVALGSLTSVLFLRFRRREPTIESKLERGGIGGRDSPDTVFSTSESTTDCFPRLEGEEASKSLHTYRTHETSLIYPDDSVSCYNPEAEFQLAKAYATDFAMADRQIWTDHLQSRRAEETSVLSRHIMIPWARERPRVDSGTTLDDSMGFNGLPPLPRYK